MLEQLIEITNSEAFILKGNLIINEVVARQKTFDLKIRFMIIDHINDLIQYEGEIFCEGHGTSSRLEGLKFPYNRIKLYTSHPALWENNNILYLNLQGSVTNVAELIGDLYIAHNNACGNWIDFHRLFFSIPQWINTKEGATIHIPESLLETYQPIFNKHGVTFSKRSTDKGKHKHSLLLFGNPGISPDNFYLLQPYIIAEKFTVTMNEVNRLMY
ncbi:MULTISPECIES: hypothetical protein [Niastella]|uniref:Uncharacterized protein n=1 Tax=Niastella soli TaxID=2821487 RepID=A0ABS3Z4Y9_9BACT|nr:hypothetical protein [Niastella soli]MBO9205236.1 hypothetical protein [Niastella soli]